MSCDDAVFLFGRRAHKKSNNIMESGSIFPLDIDLYDDEAAAVKFGVDRKKEQG